MFIVFEGIDGSGKTTISNRVAKNLREKGIDVEHVREGGEFASPLVSRMREFGKDPRNMAMDPYTELLLYVARESQLLHECTRPALEKNEVVFADRYLYSYDVLSHNGRGLPRERIKKVLDATAQGLWPDFVVLMDVDPHLARARRKVSKISTRAKGQKAGGGSRKGLGGVGMKHRLREGYLNLAKEESDKWLVVDNTHSGLDEVVERLTKAIYDFVKGKDAKAVIEDANIEMADPVRMKSVSLEIGQKAFYKMIEKRAASEPTVAAYFLSGLDDDKAFEYRERFCETAPHAVAHGLESMNDEKSWAMREALKKVTPVFVIKSLSGRMMDKERVWNYFEEFKESHLNDVVSQLSGDDSDRAWGFRALVEKDDPLRVLRSLSKIDSERAWATRESFIKDKGVKSIKTSPLLAAALASSLKGIGTERAFELREWCAISAPSQVLASLSGLECEESWDWRKRYCEQAPKIVLRTFDGQDSEVAWEMRGQFAEEAKETIDSMIGLDSDEAWSIRERVKDVWPSTVLKSLNVLGLEEKGLSMALDILARYPQNFSVLKHVAKLYNRHQKQEQDQ